MPARNQVLSRFGNALREERKRRGISQEQLALRSEINRTYMGGVERGEENISLLTLIKISTVLTARPSDILAKAKL